MNWALSDEDLNSFGLDPAMRWNLILEPGDVAFWHLYLVHGSGPNIAKIDRRFYFNGFVSAANCDHGKWTFNNSKPCPLGELVLVQYEDLHDRLEPHYIDG